MHSFLRNSSQTVSPGSTTFGSWQVRPQVGSGWFGFKSAAWNTLKFIAFLPVALAMALVNLIAWTAAVIVPVLLIPLALFAPVLIVAGLILAPGFLLQLLGVG